MADFPLTAPGFVEQISAQTVTTSATANTKGSWVELVTSTAYDADGILISLRSSGSGISWLFDFGVGGAGSEVVIAANFLFAQDTGIIGYFHLPVSVPAGTRIAARSQGSTGSSTPILRAHLIRGGLWSPPSAGRIVTLGANTADSGGATVDCGASANTLGAWSELSSAVPDDIAGLWLNLGNRNNTAATLAATFRIQLGVGAAASENPVWGPVEFLSGLSSYGPLPAVWWPVAIPAGERLAVRCQSNITDATDRKFDAVAYGLVI